MPRASTNRLLIIGWDAADWKIIDPLLARGDMPNLRRLIDAGVRADLASLDPKLSPILWTSIATGKTGDKHGVLNFLEPDPHSAGVRLSSSCTRRTKALWNILTQRGLPTVVVSWYASHPAEPILGACVSNLLQESCPDSASQPWPLASGSVHPTALRDRVGSLRVHPRQVSRAEVLAVDRALGELANDDRRLKLVRKLLAQCRTVHNVALELLVDRPWSCGMVFFDTIDVAGHHFMQFRPPRMQHVSQRDFATLRGVVDGAYRLHDRMLGQLIERAGPGTTVLLLSDHGFHSDHLRPSVQTSTEDEHAAMDATWHRQLGVLVMSGPGVEPGQTVLGPNLLDIAPTALALLGLPVGADMDGRVLVEALRQPTEIERLASWDRESGETGLHPADARVDPSDAREAMRQLAELGYITPVGADQQQTLDSVDRETRSNLGIVYMSTRRPAEALPIFERLHREQPHEQRFAMNLAHCQHALGRHADAQGTLQSFLAIHPHAPDALNLQAGVLIAQQSFAEAALVLEAASRASPDNPDALCSLAEVYAVLDRLADAEHAARRALSIDPQHARSHHTLARVALLRRDFEPAAEHALDALQLHNHLADAHYTLGAALAWLDDLEHAIASFRVAVSLQPGMLEAHRFLAVIYRYLHDSPNAALHREQAERLAATAASAGAVQAAPRVPVPDSPVFADTWATSHARA